MENKNGKAALNDDLLDKVSGGSHELDTAPDCDFKGCPYGLVCLDGQPCPLTREPGFDVTYRDI